MTGVRQLTAACFKNSSLSSRPALFLKVQVFTAAHKIGTAERMAGDPLCQQIRYEGRKSCLAPAVILITQPLHERQAAGFPGRTVFI